jgi:hypothetical protein
MTQVTERAHQPAADHNLHTNITKNYGIGAMATAAGTEEKLNDSFRLPI